MFKKSIYFIISLLLLSCGPVHDTAPTNSNANLDIGDGDDGNQAPKKIYYEGAVKNTIQAKCVSCHNAQSLVGGLRLDNYSLLFTQKTSKFGEQELVAVGSAIDSGLYKSVEMDWMPFGSGPKYTEDERTLLKQWIEDGALLKAPE